MIRLVVHDCAFDVTDRQVTHQCKGNRDFIKFALLRKCKQAFFRQIAGLVQSPDGRFRRCIACGAFPHLGLDLVLGLRNDRSAKLSIFPIGGFKLFLHLLAGG